MGELFLPGYEEVNKSMTSTKAASNFASAFSAPNCYRVVQRTDIDVGYTGEANGEKRSETTSSS